MFIRIRNTPRDYAWGSPTAIAELLGSTPSGGPEAELWLGAHPGSPAVLDDGETLDRWLAAHPNALGGRPRLPFLLKVLAAASPLSLQVHPTIAQAEAGFAREDAAGIPVGAPNRNYRDRSHKPEIIVALSDEFHALAGFRELATTRLLIAELAAVHRSADITAFGERLAAADEEHALRGAVEWLLSGDPGVAALVDALVLAAAQEPGSSSFAREYATVGELARAYPGDPGIAVALLLNRVTLKRDEALALPAGNVHAYLGGLGIEVMAASDNVLRGGLTPKHIDVPELLAVATFGALPVPIVTPTAPAPGVTVYAPGFDEFEVVRVLLPADDVATATLELRGPAVAIAVSGALELASDSETARLARGEAVFVTADAGALVVRAAGELFLATTP